jgi:DNA-directed RNA polymerase specialized sigma subunit
MDKFDYEKGYKTISYSVWWIKQSILEALKERAGIEGESLPEDFEKQKKRDQSVRDYCKDHNIIYIEIPFTFDTKESIDNILTDVILNGNFKDRQIILEK